MLTHTRDTAMAAESGNDRVERARSDDSLPYGIVRGGEVPQNTARSPADCPVFSVRAKRDNDWTEDACAANGFLDNIIPGDEVGQSI